MTAHRVYLVGLAGPAGVGKSTVAQALCSLPKSADCPPFRRQRFAGAIKDMLTAFGLTREQLDGDQKETPCDLLGGRTSRWGMRSLGDWGRGHDPDFWVWPTMRRVEQDLCQGFGVVVDDVRFDNEAAAIARLGGIIVQLRRDGVQASNDHASEAGIHGELVHYIVPNNTAPGAVAHDIAWLLNTRTP